MNEYFFHGKERLVAPTDWIFVAFILVSALLILTRILFPRYNWRITFAFFNDYEGIKLITEKGTLLPRESYMLAVIPLFNVSLLVNQQIGWFNPDFVLYHAVVNYVKVFALVFLFVLFRLLFVWLMAWLLQLKEIGLRFNQMWMLHWLNLGIYTFAPAFIVPFLHGNMKIIALIVIWLAVVAWLIYTAFKELRILISYRISLFYLILYLCTLEILPLWWAVKTVMQVW